MGLVEKGCYLSCGCLGPSDQVALRLLKQKFVQTGQRFWRRFREIPVLSTRKAKKKTLLIRFQENITFFLLDSQHTCPSKYSGCFVASCVAGWCFFWPTRAPIAHASPSHSFYHSHKTAKREVLPCTMYEEPDLDSRK